MSYPSLACLRQRTHGSFDPEDPGRTDRLSSDDLRGLSVLFYMNINPFGRYGVDLVE
ncbi:MAG: hypothetical protein OXI87_02930 [Albidovulum sp.]|nr:hypothetical protein [Albidovulum sp.]MDE0303828.1 hypothetical protein [Albidovulum sp.]MDE0532736.1 hypothetical protein [Albidovulum sp.]